MHVQTLCNLLSLTRIFRIFGCLILFFSLEILHAQSDSWRHHYDRQNYALAVEILEGERVIYPDSIFLLENVGVLYFHLGDYISSGKIWNHVLQLDSLNKVAIFRQGLIHYEVGRYLEAVEWWQKLVELDGSNPYYFKMLGRAWRNLNNPLETFSAYNKVRNLNPRDLEAMEQLADLFFKQKQYSEADSLLTMALHLYPIHQKLRVMQIETCYSDRYYGHTLDLIYTYEDDFPLTNYLKRVKAASLIKQEAWDEAIEVLKSVEDPDQNEEMTFLYLHRAYQGKGDLIMSRHFIEKCIETCKHPEEGTYIAYLGNVLVDSGMYAQAAQAFASAALLKDDANLVYLAARYYDAAEDSRMAAFYYQRYLFLMKEEGDIESISFSKERLELLKQN